MKRTKILALAPYYPHAGHLFGGLFNERSVLVLRDLCDDVAVLVPRPYSPPVLSSLVPRWKIYSKIPSREVRNGIPVYRPPYLQIPRIGGAFWTDPGAFFFCRQAVRAMHGREGFDAIVSFDLAGAGGLAWRLGRDLGIPACGWATGTDVRVSAASSYGRAVARAVKHLDLVFYQSCELLEKAAGLMESPLVEMPRDRHMVLPRGITEPPMFHRMETRSRLRKEWGISQDDVLILSIGRILREKGILDLLNVIALASGQNPAIRCMVVGSNPAFDDTTAVRKKLQAMGEIGQRVLLLPACNPEKVWEFLCAADLFAFTSYHEGMPNSLLEAMAMGVPSIAFAIPAVMEIEAGLGAPFLVPPFDSKAFAQAVLRLAATPYDRSRIGEIGRKRVHDRYMVRKNMAAALAKLLNLIENRSRESVGKLDLHPQVVNPGQRPQQPQRHA